MKDKRLETPSVDRATEALRDYVHIAASRRLVRLPSVSQLSSALGVSRVTLLKAVRRLTDEGLVVPKRGSGVFIQESLPKAAVELPRSKPLRRTPAEVARELRRQLLRGTLPPGAPLPSIKDLCTKMGASHPTVSKALSQLREEGLVENERRKFRATSTPAQSGNTGIALFARGNHDGTFQYTSPRTLRMVTALETACGRAGVQLYPITLRMSRSRGWLPKQSAARLSELTGKGALLGAMFWNSGIPDNGLRPLLEDFSRTGLPAAYLDETGSCTPAQVGNLASHFSCGVSDAASRRIGRYLLGKGHRKVAYLSHHHSSLGSQQRLRGLGDIFAEAGYPGSVRAFVFTKSQYEDTLDEARDTAEDVVMSTVGNALSKDLAAAARAAASAAGGATRRILERETTWPLMDAALGDRSISAWVAYNDALAVDCIRYIRSRRRKVPQDISVIGFDNSVEAYENGLTSYDYDPSSLAHSMLEVLIRPRLFASVAAQGRRSNEAPGFLVVRRSSGEAG